MCTPDVAMPCPCCAWQGCAMPPHLRTIGSSRARTLAVPCFPTLNSHPAQSHISLQPHFPSSPYSLSFTLPTRFHSLSLLVFHHSLDSLFIPLSSPHRPYPILATFLSMACVLKRFPLTSPRKLALPCVKRGFLRTAEPHRTSQLSPCAPLMSHCHAHAVPGSDVPCPHTFGPLPCTCTRLSLSQVFDHYQHLSNSVVVVYISFRKFLLSLKM